MEKEKATLDVTTQKNIRSAILPLTKRYWTDLLSQKLSILSVKFYTDTPFGYNTYVQSNKCAQLYADRDEVVHVLSMRSNDKVGESLGNVVKDIGIMN